MSWLILFLCILLHGIAVHLLFLLKLPHVAFYEVLLNAANFVWIQLTAF
jgi:hypothetical protein